ncbi:MAG: hypothetical protein LH480_16110 [Rubrivivax sp.]|nr:hypothetical protein [Rubrivivax sp.]
MANVSASGRKQIPAQRRAYQEDGGEPLARRPGAPVVLAPVAAAASLIAAVAAPPSARPPAVPPAAAPPPAAPTPYVGERPVDTAWLAQREAALKSIPAHFETARAQALAQPGTSVGWINAHVMFHPGRDSRPIGINGVLVELHDPAAEPVHLGSDEGGAQYGAAPGCWVTFD